MKVPFLLYILTIVCFQSKAQTNSLVVFSEVGRPLMLVLDGQPINKTYEANIKALRVSTGKHQLQLIQLKNGIETIYKDSIIIGSSEKFLNKEYTFVLTEDATKKETLRFKSISELSAPEKPIIPEAPKEKVPLVDSSIYGNLYQAIKNKPVFYNHYYNKTKTCDYNLSEKDILYAQQLIKNCNDPDQQYKYLVELTEKNCFTCEQYKQLLALMPVDLDKLTASKIAYTHLIDKENSKQLSNSFKYKSMQETYTSFLKEQVDLKNQANRNCTTEVNESVFKEFILKITQQNSEYDKWKLSKAFVIDHCISTTQAKQITALFLHDREKIDFFEATYQSLTDKPQAYHLAEELQSDSDKQQYLQFLKQHEQ